MQASDHKIIEEKLPFLHPKVNLSDIKSNGKILDDDDIIIVKKMLEDKNTIQYKNCEIVKLQSGQSYVYYATYTPGTLGRGAFGEVTLSQNLDSAEWVAKKIQSHEIESMDSEIKHMQTLGSPVLVLKRMLESKNNRKPEAEEVVVVMPLVQGLELKEISNKSFIMEAHEKRSLLSPQEWFQHAINSMEAIQVLHDKNIIHQDLHLGNLMVDTVSGNVSPIDFGRSLQLDPIQLTVKRDGRTLDAKSDVYSLSSPYSIPALLGCGDCQVNFSTKEEFLKHKKQSPNLFASMDLRLPSEDLQFSVNQVFQKMRAPNSQNQIDLKTAIDQLKSIFNEYFLNINCNVKKTGLLDLDEYSKANAHERERMRAALVNAEFKEVWLIDANQSHKDKYLTFRKELEQAGIPIGNSIFHDSNPANIIKSIPEEKSKKDNTIRAYFLVSNNVEAMQELGESNSICLLKPSSNKKTIQTQMKDHFKKCNLKDYQISYIINQLMAENGRIKKKYKLPDNTTDDINALSKPQRRMKFIDDTISKIKNGNVKTYSELEHELDQLQRNVSSLFLIDTTATKKTIKHIKEEVIRPSMKR